MYIITDSKNVAARKDPCLVGVPYDMEPDLCIINPGNPSNVISINSNVLREALLADPMFVLSRLGIKVEDKKGVLK